MAKEACFLVCRGLDVHPKTIQRFAAQGDHESVRLMRQIYEDEITHVACGLKWFTYICERSHPQMVRLIFEMRFFLFLPRLALFFHIKLDP